MKVAIILVWGGVRDFNKRFQRDLMSFPRFWNSVLLFINVKATKTTLCSQIWPKMSSKYLKTGYKTHFPMKVAIILVWGGVRDFTKCFREDLMSIYWFWNCALLFINVEATKTTLCSQSCPKMVSVWSRIGLSLVWDWSQFGLGLVSDWSAIGLSLVSGWSQFGLGLVLVWNWSGIGLGFVSNWPGIGLGLVWD